jgi:hypothetical protein
LVQWFLLCSQKNLLFSKDAFVRTNKNITKDRGPS